MDVRRLPCFMQRNYRLHRHDCLREGSCGERVSRAKSRGRGTNTYQPELGWCGTARLFSGSPRTRSGKVCFPSRHETWMASPRSYELRRTCAGRTAIIGQDGKTKVVHEGEAVVEMVGTIHHGENRGTKPVILYMFYLSQKDLPLAVQHPEIPMN